MKRKKGVSLIERIFDKLLVAVFLAVFLGVVAWQLNSGPGVVRVGSSENVPLDRAYERLGQAASQLSVQLDAEAPDAQMPAPPAPVADQLARALELDPEAEAQLATPLVIANTPTVGGEQLAAGGNDTPLENPAFGLPIIPAPTAVVANVTAGAMDPFEPALHADLASAHVIPSEQPFDFRAVTVQASFDAARLLEAIHADPDGDAGPLGAAPENWWRSRLAAVDVEVERQRVNAKGEPIEQPMRVPPAPGRLSWREQLVAQMPAGDLDRLVREAQQTAKQVLQPRFYGMIAGGVWRLPAVETELASKLDEARRLTRKRESVLEQIGQLQKSAFQPLGGGGGGKKGGNPNNKNSAEKRKKEEQARAAENRAKRIDELQTQLSQVEQKLLDLGFDVDGKPMGDQTVAALTGPAPELSEPTSFAFWAFDPFVEPGARYRYRIRLAFANPLYGRDSTIAASSHDFAISPTISSQWSVWTDAVDIDRNSYLFVTRASAGNLGQEATATAELFQFFYGGWRQISRRVSQGDALQVSTPLAKLSDDPFPRFDIELGDDGVPHVASTANLAGPLAFDVNGAFVEAITLAPGSAGGRNGVFNVILRTTASPNVEVRRPQAEGALPVHRRLAQAAEATRSARIGIAGATVDKKSLRRPKRDKGASKRTSNRAPSSGPGGS